MAKFKQTQIHPGVTKTRSNALKVYVASAIAENDIIVATGMQGDFLSVEPADNTSITKCRGPFFVADYAAAAGEYTPVAVPLKTITDKDTSAAAQVGDAVYLSTGGDVTLGAVPAATADGAAFSANIRVGRITSVNASTGAYVLEPGIANGAPIVGKVTCSGTSSTVTGFTAELDGAPVVVSMDANIATTGAVIASGTLTIHHASSTDDATYVIFA
tara:strand:+ start:875 stop:1522 length:648 start_codon:yes stop_codon:yes gene_type:complete